jgi:hypothetical protein
MRAKNIFEERNDSVHSSITKNEKPIYIHMYVQYIKICCNRIINYNATQKKKLLDIEMRIDNDNVQNDCTH